MPLLSREHSAQVPQEDRVEIETEFKKPNGRFNCLVATPTLEMGVDIGPLELVLMRNVPPSPSSYAQRSGRAGRRHRIGAIFTYCRRAQHDRWFYREPESMISGEVRVPAFSMRNEPLVRKHIHSTVLTALRSIPAAAPQLEKALPTWIWSWFGEKTPGSRTDTATANQTSRASARSSTPTSPELLESLRRTFTDQWPEEDAELVTPERIEKLLDEVSTDLDAAAATLVAEVRAYRSRIDEYGERQRDGEQLSEEDLKHRQGYERALQRLWSETQPNYTISWLARHGFFPGYALVRDSVAAQSLEPPLDLSRPLPVAVRELGAGEPPLRQPTAVPHPAVRLPPARSRPPRLQPGGARGTDVPRPARQPGRFETAGCRREKLPPVGLLLASNDRRRARTARADLRPGGIPLPGRLRAHPVLLPHHRGGHEGKVGDLRYRFLQEARLRIVNLGVRGLVRGEKTRGFPICLVCGETRSPFASSAEIDSFSDFHGKHCGRPTGRHALHVDATSDLLELGPFDQAGEAVNLLESLRIGTRQVLEMGDAELDIAITRDEEGRSSASSSIRFPEEAGSCRFSSSSGIRFSTPRTVASKAAAARRPAIAASSTSGTSRSTPSSTGASPGAFSPRREAAGSARIPSLRDSSRPSRPPRRPTATAKTCSSPRLQARQFPLPTERRFPIELGGGSHTVPDFAWPERKVVLYVDGLSARIHGNPEQRRRDRILRIKARSLGWQVCEISAEGLRDKKMLAALLEELAVYLGVEG